MLESYGLTMYSLSHLILPSAPGKLPGSLLLTEFHCLIRNDEERSATFYPGSKGAMGWYV